MRRANAGWLSVHVLASQSRDVLVPQNMVNSSSLPVTLKAALGRLMNSSRMAKSETRALAGHASTKVPSLELRRQLRQLAVHVRVVLGCRMGSLCEVSG